MSDGRKELVLVKQFAARRDRIESVGLHWDNKEEGRLVMSLSVAGRMVSVKEDDPRETVRLYCHVVGECNGLSGQEKGELAALLYDDLGL